MGNTGDGLNLEQQLGQSSGGGRLNPGPVSVDDGDDDTINPNLRDSLAVASQHGFVFKSGHLPTGERKSE